MSLQYVKEAGTFDITKVTGAGLNKFINSKGETYYVDLTLEISVHGNARLVGYRGFLTEKGIDITVDNLAKLGFNGDPDDLCGENAVDSFNRPKDVNIKVEEEVYEGKVYYKGSFINLRANKQYITKSEASSVLSKLDFGGKNIRAKKKISEKYKENFLQEKDTIEETTINKDLLNPIPFW